MKSNVVLIGMSGAGKSTLGVLLAKAMGKDFADTDLLLQRQAGCTLQKLLDTDGIDAFLAAEEQTLCALRVRDTVVATGGSAVYSDAAMRALSRDGTVVYLRVPFEEVSRRLTDITTRGVVLRPGQTLAGLYAERAPLYERYADCAVDCAGKSAERCVEELLRVLDERKTGDCGQAQMSE